MHASVCTDVWVRQKYINAKTDEKVHIYIYITILYHGFLCKLTHIFGYDSI